MINKAENTYERKWISGIVAFMLVFSMLFSTVYIAVESGHDCSGEDCPICFSLVQCEEIFRLFRFTVILLIPFIYLCVSSIEHINKPDNFFIAITPVSLKIQLNN